MMLTETPTWEFTAKQPLTRWYEHVRLRNDKVIGQWFCLDRRTGAVYWEQNLPCDEIVDIADGVIIANERQRQHIGSFRYGCFGISLETGKILWTSHSSGFWDGLRRLTGWTDYPAYVCDGRVVCRSGRVLNVKTGTLLNRIQKEAVKKPKLPESETIILGRSKSLTDPVRLQVSEGRWLSHKLETKENVDSTDDKFFKSVWDYCLFLTDENGKVRWTFDLANTGYEVCYCPYEEKCRFSYPYLYLLVCEKRATRMEKKLEVYNPSQFHLLTIDLVAGEIVQDIRVFDHPMENCRFEDLDSDGVLISDSNRSLLHFERLQANSQT